MTPDFVSTADGSVFIELGGTRVLCSAQIVNGVPGWRRGSGEGWLTAEYSLLPSSTRERTPREAVRGRQDGRTVEIQRFIGRSLRAVLDMKALGERTIYVDCDVIEADGGTRCAAVTGAYLALHLACKRAVDARTLTSPAPGRLRGGGERGRRRRPARRRPRVRGGLPRRGRHERGDDRLREGSSRSRPRPSRFPSNEWCSTSCSIWRPTQ